LKSVLKWILGISAGICAMSAVCLQSANVSADVEATAEHSATVTEINNEGLDNGNSFVMCLSGNPYMTTEDWNKNKNWLNAEEVTDRTNVDFSANNLCNIPLDQNLSEYNLEDYIYVDGETLAEFSKTHDYKVIANKRQRVNTISLDFDPNVLSSIEVIEIKAGCQLPTIEYSYLGTGEFSCIEIQEDAKFEKRSGAWREYFGGYEEGVEYNGSKDYFNRFLQTSYKGHTAVSLNSHTNFFAEHEIQGEKLEGNTALVSVSNTEAGNLMVLNFVNPINPDEFNRLNLRVYINHQIDVLTYNADSITEESLGSALEAFTVGGGKFTYLQLNTALYVGDDNLVDAIVFKFVDDCQPQYRDGEILYDPNGEIIRDTFFFVSFNLEYEEGGDLVSEDSFMVVENGDVYDLTFRFNKFGPIENAELDTSKVEINGYPLSKLLAENKDVVAQWYPSRGIYQINVSIPKSYTGAAQIKNPQYNFTGNNMSVLEGLAFPNGEILEKSYTCHLYTGENLLDSELIKEYKSVEVERVLFNYVEETGNLEFVVYFNTPITASGYNHACEREDWRADEDVKDIIHYDEGSAEIFIAGGYKSSLLDNIRLNGFTVGEWHALDARALTNIQVHYGRALEMNRLDICIESASKGTYNRLYDFAMEGEGITIEVLSGLKFMTGRRVEKTQTFEMKGGVFYEQILGNALHVYFDGCEVKDGQEIVVQTAVSKASVAVVGAQGYKIDCKEKDGKKTYTITYDGDKTFSFTVKEDIVKTPTEEKEEGCSSYLGIGAMGAVTLIGLTALLARKKEEEV